ncbi:hypothetical protein AB0873_17625 [Micromonospora sp. NPDC047707]|uniref:hypothetical protein n=1 Tax=Micromonospora sp. NPDC047707 TaxID=3154498 RepID=UPI00345308A4
MLWHDLQHLAGIVRLLAYLDLPASIAEVHHPSRESPSRFRTRSGISSIRICKPPEVDLRTGPVRRNHWRAV